MAKIYIVSSGEYSGYSIEGVYSTKELALAAADLIEGNDIEEYELDGYADKIQQGLHLFNVYMDKSGAADIYPSTFGEENFSLYKHIDGAIRMSMLCYAKDKEHAAKIAGERRRELLATDEWKLPEQ